jgi:DnaJ-class molecular chaperone
MNEKIKHALEVCERVMNHACEVGDSEWSVYSGFREAREAIKAAQQSVQADVCPVCKGLKIVRNDDGLGSQVCPACNGTGQRR